MDFGDAFSSEDAFLATAITFEDLGVSAYNGAGPMISSKDLLATAGAIVQVEARHAAAVRNAAGEPAAPDAFDPTLTVEEVTKAVRHSWPSKTAVLAAVGGPRFRGGRRLRQRLGGDDPRRGVGRHWRRCRDRRLRVRDRRRSRCLPARRSPSRTRTPPRTPRPPTIRSFDTEGARKGDSAEETFDDPGTYRYYCRFHVFMKGSVVVE